MNAIQHAMKEAGMRLPPLNKRIWLWLHDHPGKTYDEIAAALGAKAANVSGTLTNLSQRGMVTFITALSLHSACTGRHPPVRRFTTVGHEFELRPLPAKLKPTKAAAPAPIAPAKAAESVITLVPRKVGRPAKMTDKLTTHLAVGVPLDVLALIDRCVAGMEKDHCVTLSRTQVISMVFKQYFQGVPS